MEIIVIVSREEKEFLLAFDWAGNICEVTIGNSKWFGSALVQICLFFPSIFLLCCVGCDGQGQGEDWHAPHTLRKLLHRTLALLLAALLPTSLNGHALGAFN